MKLRKRALMEANKGAEIRRVHVVYFLCRMGHVEQPHLIRVHHLARGGGGGCGGVYLRDVKRWLGELRGKAMPEAFSWSYKRKYRAGYVWQDLVDDDLITPISDNEYVLQGSQLYPNSFSDNSRLSSSSSLRKKSVCREELELNEDSERSTVTDDGDPMKVEEEAKKLEAAKQGIAEEIEERYAKMVDSKEKDKDKEPMEKEGGSTSTVMSSSSSSSSQHTFTKSKSYSSGASSMIRQWITCGAVDTNDAVLIKHPSPKDPSLEKLKNDVVFCRDDELGGSARVVRNSWDGNLELSHQHSQQSSRKSFDDSRKKRQKESGGKKMAVAAAAAATYKPMAGPNCSLCGKTFKPEKMHSHMKSCRGVKSLTTKTAPTSSKSTTATTSDKELVSTYLLTN